LSLLAPRRRYGPDFLNPASGTPGTTFAAELATVRATPAARVRREIDRCLSERFGRDPPPSARGLLRRGETARELCAQTLEAAWHALVEPWWPRLRQILEADIAYRSRLVADAGLSAALTELHPRLTWAGKALQVDIRHSEEVPVGVEGIVLVPSVFGSPGVGYQPPSIGYQARAIASLWGNPAASSEPLARLLGARRADILLNLAVLRAAGLVSTRRTGRRLQHTRTPLGTALIEHSS
jgi:Family of unknown function (DUF5937)/Helix-turn-helix domain